MGIDKNIKVPLLEIIEFYKKKNDTANMMKYYILGVEKNIHGCKTAFNDYLDSCTDIQILIDYRKHLNSKNMRRLNEKYVTYLRVKDIDFSSLDNVKECIICMDDKNIVNFSCNHGVCYNCYNQIITTKKCPYCRGTI